MKWNGIRIPVVVMALVVGLGTFWGAQWLYNRFNYERPLAQLLEENGDVAEYRINDGGPVLELEVKLGRVDNLQQSYSNLHRSLQEVVGRRSFRIILRDQRDPALEGIYYHTRLAAFEALERGNFLEMEAYISQLAAREGARARVLIDQDRLYIQVDRGSHYLYEIIPRTRAFGVVSGEGGERRNPS